MKRNFSDEPIGIDENLSDNHHDLMDNDLNDGIKQRTTYLSHRGVLRLHTSTTTTTPDDPDERVEIRSSDATATSIKSSQQYSHIPMNHNDDHDEDNQDDDEEEDDRKPFLSALLQSSLPYDIVADIR